MTRLGDLLHFGQLFETCGQNHFAQIAHILGNFFKGVKIFHFYGEIIFGQLLWKFSHLLLVTGLDDASSFHFTPFFVVGVEPNVGVLTRERSFGVVFLQDFLYGIIYPFIGTENSVTPFKDLRIKAIIIIITNNKPR